MKLKIKALLLVIKTLTAIAVIGGGGYYMSIVVSKEVGVWVLLTPLLMFCVYVMYKGAYYHYEAIEKVEEKEENRLQAIHKLKAEAAKAAGQSTQKRSPLRAVKD